jgi:hypothetical protein
MQLPLGGRGMATDCQMGPVSGIIDGVMRATRTCSGTRGRCSRAMRARLPKIELPPPCRDEGLHDARDFPGADPDTGNFDLHAIARSRGSAALNSSSVTCRDGARPPRAGRRGVQLESACQYRAGEVMIAPGRAIQGMGQPSCCLAELSGSPRSGDRSRSSHHAYRPTQPHGGHV